MDHVPPPTVALARQHALGDLPRRSARRTPGKTAVVDPAHGVSLTYADLDACIDRTAAALQAAGLAKGDRLALLARNSWAYVVLNFACARAGVVLVPLNFMLGPAEVAFILDHSEARALVCDAEHVAVAEAAMERQETASPTLLAAIGGEQGRWLDAQAWFDHEGAPEPVAMADEDPVRLMYTSGTESRPKGAVMTSRALMWQYVSCALEADYSPDDVELHTLPLYHCAQLDVFLGPDIWMGATSIVLPAPEPEKVLAAIAEHRVTKFFAPPTVWISLLRCPAFGSTDLSSLQKGYYGASPMPVEIRKEMSSRLPDVRLFNLYGQTEMSPLATFLGPDEQLSHAGSAGRPALNVETRIVDDDGVDVPQGEVGEIVHRSPHATLGYYRDEVKTAEAFAGGWFHSGDLGYLDEGGRLYVVDRKKDMIKTGGENVASREVEEAIYELEGVAEVAVFGVAHPRWVEAVTAVVVPKAGAEVTPEDVGAHARSVLAGYKAPKYVVVADSLPKNPSGKILKRQLRDEHADIATDG
ncbi:fatty acyl-CoA synthetase [Nocardioides sp. CFH 31398]|uniref:fatty acyl-CoA synthetase n=1 Tax=Nocardioides sp. CFH 31398 TaxID=2919579 RepID=UPI001F060E83|nr:fatty acyl-CoA synthetase [Nocardioides sp. CFH 31398]MCH1865952.1 fatty acyl-CoA synthetase [Nocardioides sp. CFH 31398]